MQNCTHMEKLVHALVISARKLMPYFKSHMIKVITSYPLRAILYKLDPVGLMAFWAIELGAFDIKYVPQTTMKYQIIAESNQEILVSFQEA